MTTIVLAGGKGTRLMSVVSDIPKPLIPVAGKPFLHWLVRWIAAQGESKVIFAARHLADQLVQWASAEQADYPSCSLQVVVEPEALDTGGAVLFAAAALPSSLFLVLNGDSITFVSLRAAWEELERCPDLDGVIVAVAVEDASRFGSLDVDAHGMLNGFAEKRPGAGLINAGMYLLRSRLLSDIAPSRLSMERDLFPSWLAAGKNFHVAVSRQPFIDIGTPETLAAGEEFISRHLHYFDRVESLPAVEILGASAHA